MKFLIPVTLFKQLGCQTFISSDKVSNMTKNPRKITINLSKYKYNQRARNCPIHLPFISFSVEFTAAISARVVARTFIKVVFSDATAACVSAREPSRSFSECIRILAGLLIGRLSAATSSFPVKVETAVITNTGIIILILFYFTTFNSL